MKAIMQQSAGHSTTTTGKRELKLPALWYKFTNWATAQQKNNFLWLAISLVGHATIFTQLTLIIVYLTGNAFTLFIAAVISMMAVVVADLASLPTKYTIPVFFLSLLVDIIIIIAAVALWIK